MEKLDSLIEAAVGTDETLRRKALHDLLGYGPDAAAAITASWRTQPPGRLLRLTPIMVRWPPELVASLLSPLLSDRAPGVAVSAATILGRTHHPVVVPSLAAALHLPVMHTAAAALGENGCSSGAQPLQDLFERIVGDSSDFAAVDQRDSSDAKLLAIAVQALGQLGDARNARWLIDIVTSAEELSAREAAAEALRDVPVAEALVALTDALTGPTDDLQANALRALWSYRTVEAIDAVVAVHLASHLLSNGEAMLYDIAAVDVAEDEAWAAIWSQRRVHLPPEACLLAGAPITVQALVDRVRTGTRVEQALGELALFYGFRPRWDGALDGPAALLDEVGRWVREAGPGFAAGRMYRFGREVPAERLPRPRR